MDTIIEIKANVILFDRWVLLSYRIRNMSGIVQNDMKLSRREVFDWIKETNSISEEYKKLVLDTESYLVECGA